LVVRVVDGDTIVVQHGGKPETVRLIGVDTPEEVDPRKPVQYFAKEATRFTTQLTLNQRMRLDIQETPTSRDRYGRLLAFVFRQSDDLFINKEIIKQGFGFAYLKYPFDPQMMDDFRATEREARENKRGLWAPVVDKYHEMTVPKHEPRAESWLKMGDNLATANPVAAKGWYEKIVNEYPRSTQCPVARERLKLPPAQQIVFPRWTAK
jgi:micrococcal nuclease